MSEIKALFNLDYPTIIIGFFIIILGVDKIISLLGKVKTFFRIKFGYEEDKTTIEDRIKTLESHDNWQYKEIQKISNGVEHITKSLLDNEVQSLRWELLDFCSSLINGKHYNKEAFEHIFRTYEDYENLLRENNMTNGYVEESMGVIKEIYHAKLSKGEIK